MRTSPGLFHFTREPAKEGVPFGDEPTATGVAMNDVDSNQSRESGSEDPGENGDGKKSKRSKFNALLKQGWELGVEKSKEGLIQGKHALEQAAGLGHKPNVVPADDAVINGALRKVEIGWHPVAGMGGKWFAEKTGLGKLITEKVHKYPDPTQHWAVLVGDYCHELWMDEHLDVIYINEKLNREEWHTYEVGHTRFNDEALRQTGEMVIHNMREKKPGYNLISNNCQNFAVYLLDAIKMGTHKEFATAFVVYQTATGKGKINDLFEEEHPEEQEIPEGPERPGIHHQNTVQYAQQVMEENTTKLDTHETMSHYH